MNNLSNLNKITGNTAVKTFEIELTNPSSGQDTGITYKTLAATFDLNKQEIVSKKSYLELARDQWNKNMPYILALACKFQEDIIPTIPMNGLEAFRSPKFLPVQACVDKIYYFTLKNIAALHLKNLCTSQQLKQSHELQLFFRANNGDVEAQYLLAQSYLKEGKSSLKNAYNKAFTYFSLAAEQGHAKAAFEAAQLILNKKVVQEITYAFSLLRQSIMAGHFESLGVYLKHQSLFEVQTPLFWITDWVKGLPEANASDAIKIILKYPDLFAKNDVCHWQQKLKQKQIIADYDQGIELLKTEAARDAFECFEKAGKEGHIPSLIQQGMLYYDGRIGGHSKKDATTFFQKAYDLLPSLPEQDRLSIRKTLVKQLVDSYTAQGDYCREQKQWDRALAAFNAAEKYGMQKSQVRSLTQLIHIAQGKEYSILLQWDRAITAFNSAEEHASKEKKQEIENLKLPVYYERAKENIKKYKTSFLSSISSQELQTKISSIIDDLTKSRIAHANYLCGKIYAGLIPALNTALNEDKAKKAFSLAAREGHQGASLRHAMIDIANNSPATVTQLIKLAEGKVFIDEKAMRYQKKAALQLATMYEKGEKVTPSIAKAQSYYEQAARAEYKEEIQLHPGLAKAQFGLANFWLNLSAIEEIDQLSAALGPLQQAQQQNFAPAEKKLQEVEARFEEIQSALQNDILRQQNDILRQQQALAESQERKRKLDAMLLQPNKRPREQK